MLLNTDVQRIALGTLRCDNVEDIIYEAIKCGYKHIDCSPVYENEYGIGLGIQKAIENKIIERKDLWITSKLWNDCHDEHSARIACEKSIKDLGIEYIDLYLVHWPVASVPGSNNQKVARIPLSHTWKALERMVDEGLIKHLGVSNFDIQILNDLLSYCRIRPICNQVECHIYLQQNNLLEFCRRERIYLAAYCPLVRAGYTDRVLPKGINEPIIQDIAKAHNKTAAQIALRYLLQRNPYTIVVPKTSNLLHLQENLNILDFDLTEEEMNTMAAFNTNKRLIYGRGPINVFL